MHAPPESNALAKILPDSVIVSCSKHADWNIERICDDVGVTQANTSHLLRLLAQMRYLSRDSFSMDSSRAALEEFKILVTKLFEFLGRPMPSMSKVAPVRVAGSVSDDADSELQWVWNPYNLHNLLSRIDGTFRECSLADAPPPAASQC